VQPEVFWALVQRPFSNARPTITTATSSAVHRTADARKLKRIAASRRSLFSQGQIRSPVTYLSIRRPEADHLEAPPRTRPATPRPIRLALRALMDSYVSHLPAADEPPAESQSRAATRSLSTKDSGGCLTRAPHSSSSRAPKQSAKRLLKFGQGRSCHSTSSASVPGGIGNCHEVDSFRGQARTIRADGYLSLQSLDAHVSGPDAEKGRRTESQRHRRIRSSIG